MGYEFIDAVKQMRFAQTQYFKTRQKDWLVKSKNFEKIVDDMIFNKENPKLDL